MHYYMEEVSQHSIYPAPHLASLQIEATPIERRQEPIKTRWELFYAAPGSKECFMSPHLLYPSAILLNNILDKRTTNKVRLTADQSAVPFRVLHLFIATLFVFMHVCM